MINSYDIGYAAALMAAAPYWLIRPTARRKVLRALVDRMGRVGARADGRPAVMIHAVSLGEINATRGLIDRLLEARPDLHIIISTTTETGIARALELYGSRVHPVGGPASAAGAWPAVKAPPAFTIIRYPLDFSPAIERVLDALHPNVVVLMELEVWPNFIYHCAWRSIPVVLVNGRITLPSFRRYRLARPLLRRTFARLASVCAQDAVYARRFEALGVDPTRIQVTGTMKFDAAAVALRVEGDADLAAALELRPAALAGSDREAISRERVWVCGSTGPGEEPIILEQYRHLLARHARLRLVIVPRKPERFDEVARLIEAAGFQVVRRSQTLPATRKQQLIAAVSGTPAPGGQHPPPAATLLPPVILGDTMGELRRFYSLADVVFVGRTLVDLGPRQHGSDMIEPAALGKPIIVGPFTANFAEAMSRFREAGAIREVASAEALGQAVSELLSSPDAQQMGLRAQQVVVREKGAAQRHVKVILEHLDRTLGVNEAPAES